MPHVIANRVTESSTSAGVGDLVLQPVAGYPRFGDRMQPGDTCWYLIEQFSNNAPVFWEIGRGTYLGNNVLRRTQQFESTNANAAVAFDAVVKSVTMCAVAPNAASATEWRTGMGLDKVIEFLVPGGAQPGQALVVNSTGTGLIAQTIGTGTTNPTDPTPTEDFTNLVAMLDASTADLNAKSAAIT